MCTKSFNFTSFVSDLITLEVSHYVDNSLGAPRALQDEEADSSSESLQHGFSVVPFTC